MNYGPPTAIGCADWMVRVNCFSLKRSPLLVPFSLFSFFFFGLFNSTLAVLLRSKVMFGDW